VKRLLRTKVVLVVICVVATGFAFISPASGNTDSGPKADGWVISWPDDGWYQVQTEDGSQNVCEGGRSCDVNAKGFPAGKYLVINHTKGIRHTPIAVSGSGGSTGNPSTDSRPAKPVIVEALKKSSYVSVSWRPQPNVKQFDVFRNGGYVGTVFPPNNVYQDSGGRAGHRYTVTAFNHSLQPSTTSDAVVANEGNGCDPTERKRPISGISVSYPTSKTVKVSFTGDCLATTHQILLSNGDQYLGSKSVRGGVSSVTFTAKHNTLYSIQTRSFFGGQRVDGSNAEFGAVALSDEDARSMQRNAPNSVDVLVSANNTVNASDTFGESQRNLVITVGLSIPGSIRRPDLAGVFVVGLARAVNSFEEASDEYYDKRDEFDRVLNEVLATESLPGVPGPNVYGEHDTRPVAQEWAQLYGSLPDLVASNLDGTISNTELSRLVNEQLENFERKWGPIGGLSPAFGDPRPSDPSRPSYCWTSTDCSDGDYDGDGLPDLIDDDRDGDGIPNDIDRYPDTYSRDDDNDGVPDNRDWDVDNDGVPNYLDPDYVNETPVRTTTGTTTGGGSSDSDSGTGFSTHPNTDPNTPQTGGTF